MIHITTSLTVSATDTLAAPHTVEKDKVLILVDDSIYTINRTGPEPF